MSDIILRSAVKVESTKHAVVEHLSNAVTRLREEDGQDMIEYAGVLVVVAVIIAAVVAFAPSLTKTLTGDISNLVDDIFGGKSPVKS